MLISMLSPLLIQSEMRRIHGGLEQDGRIAQRSRHSAYGTRNLQKHVAKGPFLVELCL